LPNLLLITSNIFLFYLFIATCKVEFNDRFYFRRDSFVAAIVSGTFNYTEEGRRRLRNCDSSLSTSSRYIYNIYPYYRLVLKDLIDL
jgi:hypothetical protein